MCLLLNVRIIKVIGKITLVTLVVSNYYDWWNISIAYFWLKQMGRLFQVIYLYSNLIYKWAGVYGSCWATCVAYSCNTDSRGHFTHMCPSRGHNTSGLVLEGTVKGKITSVSMFFIRAGHTGGKGGAIRRTKHNFSPIYLQ